MSRRYVFERSVEIAAPAERVWAFHEAPDALARLLPPWEESEVLEPPRSLAVGTHVRIRTRVLGLWFTVEAVHTACDAPRLFVDEMKRGPFAYWRHEHHVEPLGATRTRLRDHIEYELPLGPLGALFGRPIAEARLRKMFEHRHAVTRAACEAPR